MGHPARDGVGPSKFLMSYVSCKLAKQSSGKNATDRTAYDTTRISTKSFLSTEGLRGRRGGSEWGTGINCPRLRDNLNV